jgi:short-subunit dehydrogenase
MDLAESEVLLTGAAGGIGRAIASTLAERGATLLLSGRNIEGLERLAGQLPGGGHRVLPADLANQGAAERLAAEAGAVDVLVANAALPGSGELGDLTPDEITRAIRVNLESPIQLTRAFLPAFRRRGSGHFIYITSLVSKAGSPLATMYSATKTGLRSFAFALRADVNADGIGVSIVSPGFVREAGMFADSGAKASWTMGTTSPNHVASAVAKAIERNRVEVGVAPIRQRVMAHTGLFSPSLTVRTMSGRTARKMAKAVADGQLEKR